MSTSFICLISMTHDDARLDFDDTLWFLGCDETASPGRPPCLLGLPETRASGIWTLEVGIWTLEVGIWTPGRWHLDPRRFKSGPLGVGMWTLEGNMWTLGGWNFLIKVWGVDNGIVILGG